jgi:HK97 family phage portal protein
MTQPSPLLYDARGAPINGMEKAAISTFGGPYILGSSSDLKGAAPNPRRGDWRDYWAMYERHPIVYAAINKIVKVCTNTGFDFVPRDNRQKDVSEESVSAARDFFNNQDDFIGELRRIYRDLLIFGDAYLYLVSDRRRRPKRLKRLAPWTMNVKTKKSGEVQFYIQKDPSNPYDDGVVFRDAEILHFKLDNPVDDIYGHPPLQALKGEIAADLFAASYNTNFFKNGAATGVIVTVMDATQDDIERNKRWLREEYAGTENAHKPIILAGDVKIHKSAQTHLEMGFLEGREAIKSRILAVLDVPPAKIGDMETANRSNSREQDKSFRSESIMPLQYTVEAVINDRLMAGTLGITDVLFVHSEADIRDAQEQMDLWKDAVQNGLMTINEIRSKMGLPTQQGGDTAYVMTPTGAVPVVDLELYFQLPSPNTDKIPADVHDPHGHADGEEGSGTRGPKPKPTTNIKPQVSRQTQLAQLLQAWVHKAVQSGDDADIRAAYANVFDVAKNSQEPLLVHVVASLKDALTATDDILRTAYVERAQSFLDSMLAEGGA